MPTYEYHCPACQHQFERFQSITARLIRKCPKCGQHKVRRLIGVGGGIIFKGSGFYQTDYRSDSYRQAAEKEKPPAAGAGSKEGSAPAEGSAKDSAKAEGAKPTGEPDKKTDKA